MTAKSKNSIADRVLNTFVFLFVWLIYVGLVNESFVSLAASFRSDGREVVEHQPLGWLGRIFVFGAPIAGVVVWKCLRRRKWFVQWPVATGCVCLCFYLGATFFEMALETN